MKCIKLSNEQKNRVIKLVKPDRKDQSSYQNLNLLCGVWDDEKEILLVQSYFQSASLRSTGELYDEYEFALLTEQGDYCFNCKMDNGQYSHIYSPLPRLISNEGLEQMLRFYDDNFHERSRLEKEATEGLSCGRYGYTEWYLYRHYFEVDPAEKREAALAKAREEVEQPVFKKEKVVWRAKVGIYGILGFVCIMIAIGAMVAGLSVHDLRMNPENVEMYQLGVSIGISMLCMFVLFLGGGIALIVMDYKKHK